MGGAAIPSIVAPPHPPVIILLEFWQPLPLPGGTTWQSIGASEFNLEQFRERLRRMSDEELIRYGKASRSLLTPEGNFGKPPREVFVIQLQEARKRVEKAASQKWVTLIRRAFVESECHQN
jgi:hypothetical protein